jgi:hypothetical protein
MNFIRMIASGGVEVGWASLAVGEDGDLHFRPEALWPRFHPDGKRWTWDEYSRVLAELPVPDSYVRQLVIREVLAQ